MKTKIIILLALICLSLPTKAQTIPNSGFEDWVDVGGWYFAPEHWQTNNTPFIVPVLRDTNACIGNYSLKISHEQSGMKGYAKAKFPFYGHLPVINFSIKCNIQASDTVSVLLNHYSNGQIIENAKWSSTTCIPNWDIATLALNQYASDGDSLEIIIVGGDSLQTSVCFDMFTLDLSMGNKIPKKTVWSIYPNPFSEKLTYQLPGIAAIEMIEVDIVDIYGRAIAIFRENTNQGELDLSSLPAGSYIIRIKTENELLTKKVVKQ